MLDVEVVMSFAIKKTHCHKWPWCFVFGSVFDHANQAETYLPGCWLTRQNFRHNGPFKSMQSHAQLHSGSPDCHHVLLQGVRKI